MMGRKGGWEGQGKKAKRKRNEKEKKEKKYSWEWRQESLEKEGERGTFILDERNGGKKRGKFASLSNPHVMLVSITFKY